MYQILKKSDQKHDCAERESFDRGITCVTAFSVFPRKMVNQWES
jgi:hypothetical protein